MRIPAPDGPTALADLVTPWTTASDGRVETAAVHGDAPEAIGALGPRVARITEADLSDALALMAWTGASGGAHGRRRGAATGRFGAWWVVAALAGRLDDWPLEGDDLAGSAEALRWYRWDAGEPATGWSFQLAVHDPTRGMAWAVSATDA
ncbi:MAG: hypothetical protein M5U31_09265 [Acidimicrobiia bacterium]|nr:hypothetical protein [Acidimicrobiia bacterium]